MQCRLAAACVEMTTVGGGLGDEYG